MEQVNKLVKDHQRSTDELLRLLEAAEEMAGLGHWHLEVNSQALYWSDEVFRIHGYEPGEFIPVVEEAINAYHPDDRERISQTVDKGIAEGKPWHEELRLIRADGSVRDVLAKGEPHFENGELVALFGVFQDITEQKAQQQHYRQLSQVVELTQEAIIVADKKGRVQWVNKGFEQISGFSLKEMKGKKPGEVLQGQDTDPETQKFMGKMIARREPFTAEILNYHKNGTPYWLKVNIYPQFDENGELQAFMAVETDITEVKLAQDELKQQTLALKQEIQRREELEQELRLLAYHDPLTGLHNRRYFFNQFDAELNRCRRYSHDVSLILLDIDRFKSFNDTYGHDFGDKVLVDVANVLQETVRDSDLVARVGGEEFAILVLEADLNVAAELAERVRVAVMEMELRTGNQHKLAVTISLGLSQIINTDESPGEAYQRADKALYQAKRSGRNRVCH